MSFFVLLDLQPPLWNPSVRLHLVLLVVNHHILSVDLFIFTHKSKTLPHFVCFHTKLCEFIIQHDYPCLTDKSENCREDNNRRGIPAEALACYGRSVHWCTVCALCSGKWVWGKAELYTASATAERQLRRSEKKCMDKKCTTFLLPLSQESVDVSFSSHGPGRPVCHVHWIPSGWISLIDVSTITHRVLFCSCNAAES